MGNSCWKLKRSVIVVLLISLISISYFSIFQFLPLVKANPDWLSGWQYRKSHVINSASGAGTNYQVRIKVHYGSGTDSGEDVYLNEHCRTDFGDIRFTDDDGVTELDYWMEEKVDSDYAIFWVEVKDDLSSSDVTIYIYYGNSDATTTSDGEATFLFFDDFEDGVIDTDKWSIYSGTWVEENGVLKQTDTSGTTGLHIYSAMDIGYDLALHAKLYRNTGTTYQFGTMVRASGDKQNLYLGAYDIKNDQLKLGEMKNWAWTGWVDTTPFDVQLETWYKTIFKAYGTKVEFIDEESGTTVSYTSAEDLAQKIGLHSRGGEDWFDNVFVRKYVEPEPTHGSWGSEEEVLAVEFTFNFSETVSVDASNKFSKGVSIKLFGFSNVQADSVLCKAAYIIHFEEPYIAEDLDFAKESLFNFVVSSSFLDMLDFAGIEKEFIVLSIVHSSDECKFSKEIILVPLENVKAFTQRQYAIEAEYLEIESVRFENISVQDILVYLKELGFTFTEYSNFNVAVIHHEGKVFLIVEVEQVEDEVEFGKEAAYWLFEFFETIKPIAPMIPILPAPTPEEINLELIALCVAMLAFVLATTALTRKET